MKTASLARARAPTTRTLLRRVREARRSLTARILVEFRPQFSTRARSELFEWLFRLIIRMVARALIACVLATVLAGCGAGQSLLGSSMGTVAGHVQIRACGGAYRLEQTTCPMHPYAGVTLTFTVRPPTGTGSEQAT